MPPYSLRSVLDWLRSGYPEGIPAKDHFALLAVLRRRLTNDDIERVVALAVATAPEHPDRQLDYDKIARLITDVTHEEPTQEDIERVTKNLVAGGWPVVADDAD